MVGVAYAEPYAGGGGLALHLLFDNMVREIHLNDLDPLVYSFWYSVLNRGEDFCRWIDSVQVDVASWEKYRKIIEADDADFFEKAKAFFFLNRTNVSGVIKGGIIGGKKQTGRYCIDARFNKKDLIERIEKIQRYREKIHLTNLDGVDFVVDIDRTGDILIYMDPPYYQKGSNLYMNFYSDNDHRQLSEASKRLNNPWIVSYDNHEYILSLYIGQEKIKYQLSQCTSNRIGEELLIFSNNLNYRQSIRMLNNPQFIIG